MGRLSTTEDARVRLERMQPTGPFDPVPPKEKPHATWAGGCGDSAANKKGAVAPADGMNKKGNRQVGWGLGQVSFDAGDRGSYNDDGTYYPQIDVTWTVRVKSVVATLKVNLFIDEQAPQAWRDAEREACMPR